MTDKEKYPGLELELATPASPGMLRRRYGREALKWLLKNKRVEWINGKVASSKYAHVRGKDRVPSRHEAKSAADVQSAFLDQVRLGSFRFLGLGGAGEIGRSCYYVRVGKSYVLLDAGTKFTPHGELHPEFGVLPLLPPVKAVFISHGHADHVGALSALFPMLPPGTKVFMSAKTKTIYEVILMDMANKRAITKALAGEILRRCVVADKGEVDGMKFRLYDAGHIEGSSMVYLEDSGDSVLYTGDLNFERTRMQKPAQLVPERIGTLITEATYAGKGARESRQQVEENFVRTVADEANAGRKVLIAAFAIGRTAEILDLLDDAISKRRIGIDSVNAIGLGALLATKLGEAQWRHVRLRGQGKKGSRDIFDLKEGFAGRGPMIVVAGSGSLTEGAGSQLLMDALAMTDATIVLSGYQFAGSTGRMLMEKGHKALCRVVNAPLSAHTSEDDLLKFIRAQSPGHVIVIHSENAPVFRDRLIKENIQVSTPGLLQVLFDYPHYGLSLPPISADKEVRCQCGMSFRTKMDAFKHAEETRHRLETDYSVYVFAIGGSAGGPEKHRVRRAIELAAVDGDVKDVRVLTGKVAVKGRLSSEDVERMGDLAVGPRSALRLTLETESPLLAGSPIAHPSLVVRELLDAVVRIVGRQNGIVAPVLRRRDLPSDAAEHMSQVKHTITLLSGLLGSEKDARIAVAHDIAHYIQSANPALGRVDDHTISFSEGFALYVTRILFGDGATIPPLAHEIGDEGAARDAAAAFERLERWRGRTAAMEVAMRGAPIDLGRTAPA